MILYTVLYDPGPFQRGTELRHTLVRNLRDAYFTKIVLMLQNTCQSFPEIGDPRVYLAPCYKIPTWKDIFDHARQHQPQQEIIVVANSDIVFDETITIIQRIKQLNRCFVALSKYDLNASGNWVLKEENGVESQDVWAFENPLRPFTKEDFPLGRWGAEALLAYQAHLAGYKVINPSVSIRCYHQHNSMISPARGEDLRLYGKGAFPRPFDLAYEAPPLLFSESACPPDGYAVPFIQVERE